MQKIKVILFDVDGVVVTAGRFSSYYQKRFGVEKSEMDSFFKGVFRDCIVGKADLKDELKSWLKKWKWDGTVDEFTQLWFDEGNRVDDQIIEKIKQIQEVGIKCYLATKQEKYRSEYMKKEMGFDQIFDGIFSSSEMGYKKPDPRFFQKILNELEVKPQEVLFFDDEMENVEGARNLGINSFLYTDFDQFKKIMTRFLPVQE